MSTPSHFEKLARMYLNANTNRYYSPLITIQKGKAEIEIQIKEDFFQSAGIVHGSVYFKLLDDSAYFASNSLVMDVHLVTVSFNVYFLRPLNSGIMKGIGTVSHQSNRLIIAESKVFDHRGKVAAQGTGTFMKTTIALDEKAGYI
jgi:uncharacterized protein (TIGR00369 family)